ncbi:porin [Paraburkholderia sp. D15]|uniref:porin n=1 Tax=Paraburkholderia sp. D15 TaxID=2880218 RepID=UPI002479076B|nr:porin [Paraburkholderia sp. D15]WGS51707.1 porin [Paraburkholderia sp. D15]
MSFDLYSLNHTMKKHALFGCVLSAVALGAHAGSDNSITLFGIIDQGIVYTPNQAGARAFQMVSGTTAPTKWGLHGTEDLGGGNKALFMLSTTFSGNNGTAWPSGRIFGDAAWVGLSNDRFGTLKLGRQSDSMVPYLGEFSAVGSWGGTFFAHPFDNDNLWNSFLLNNAVRYESISLAGFDFGATYAFSNKAVSTSGSGSGFADNRVWEAAARYHGGPFSAAVVYEQISHPGDDGPGALGAVDVADANFTANGQRIYGIGVAYAFQHAELHANFTRTTLSQPSSEYQSTSFTGAPSMSFNNVEINAVYHFSPAFSVEGAYMYTAARVNGSAPHWNQVGLVAEYALSHRTTVYAQGVYQRVTGDGSPFAHAQINALSAASGDVQSVMGIGLRHFF